MLMQYRLDQGCPPPPPPVMTKHLLVITGKVLHYTQASTVRIWCNIGVKIMVIVVYTDSLFFQYTSFFLCIQILYHACHSLLLWNTIYCVQKYILEGIKLNSLGFWGIEISCVQKLLFWGYKFLVCTRYMWVESSCVWKIYSRVYRNFLIHKQPSEVVIGNR